MSAAAPPAPPAPSGKHAKRTRTGCLTCRRRHYKCDETHPRCVRCIKAKARCEWDHRPRDSAGGHGGFVVAGRSRSAVTVRRTERVMDVDDYGQDIVVIEEEDEHQRETISVGLSTRETDALAYYIRNFHIYSYQICAWTDLIQLPRRSTIPTILQFERRSTRRLTNWASFFLPHLTTASSDDPLSLSMAAFTALRMDDHVTAVTLYAKVLSLLRAILSKRDAASGTNQEFLRIWATTLLLAEYESQLGHQKSQSLHVEGATTLSFIAAQRFRTVLASEEESPAPETPPEARSSHSTSTGDSRAQDGGRGGRPGRVVVAAGHSSDPTDQQPAHSDPAPGATTSSSHSSSTDQTLPRNERELPAYLMALTQRLRHSSTICESLDTEWPRFEKPPIERRSLGGLLEKSAECYALVMPLTEEFYTRMATDPPTTPDRYGAMMGALGPRVLAARRSINEYREMLHLVAGSGSSVYQSCAAPGFPFSPIIKFVNPQMAQPTVIPFIFLIFLTPFLTEDEHAQTVRYISGVFAGFEEVPGLRMNAAFPDIYIAAFWKRGPERAYFFGEVERRKGDFMAVLNAIWGIVDGLEARTGRVPSNTEILGISLGVYRDAQKRGLRLSHTRH